MKKAIGMIAMALTLAACEVSMPGITTIPEFEHRHTQEELAQADPFIRNVTKVSWSGMRALRKEIGAEPSREPVHGMTLANGDGTFDIVLVDYLSDESTAQNYDHERAHVYRLAVLGAPAVDEKNHVSWYPDTPYERAIKERDDRAKRPFAQ